MYANLKQKKTELKQKQIEATNKRKSVNEKKIHPLSE